jgi:hypothetical protein
MSKRADYYAYGDGRQFANLNLREAFDRIRRHRQWVVDPAHDPVSGTGSTLEQTSRIIIELPVVMDTYQIKYVVDIPCGDFNWMKTVNWQGKKYLGADILPELIRENNDRYKSHRVSFAVMDLTTDALPKADLIFCRDCLVHFSVGDIFKALKNIKKSGTSFLMMTTFPEEDENEDIISGGWRPLNFNIAPFGFPEPIYLLNEQCSEANGLFSDKSLGLWEVRSLPI